MAMDRNWKRLVAAASVGIGALSMTYIVSCYDFTYSPGAGPLQDGTIPDAPAEDVGDAGPPNPCPGCKGPALVRVPAPSGGADFYIDATEVTRAQYAEFLAANTDPRAFRQIPECTWNDSFQPDQSAFVDQPSSHPVTAIDWCDAYAYCQWAGKVLCGDLDGGTHANFTDPSTKDTDRWLIACTHSDDGLHNYPYGNQYSAAACNGKDKGIDGSVPVGTSPGCEGGFPGIFDMSGNVGEWENTCQAAPDGGPHNLDTCALRGGSFVHTPDEMRCTDGYMNPREQVFFDVGFRCCAK